MVTVGFVEGMAEAAAAIMKVFSGVISDMMRKRKPLMLVGYGLAALTKPVFPLANSVVWVFTARFVDRLGKGIRGAPRDALVAELTHPSMRGAAYGLRQALDSVGALIGPLLAMVLMLWLAGDIRKVLWFAVIPALVTVALLYFYVREPEHGDDAPSQHRRIRFSDAGRLTSRYWLVVALAAIFTLARFSEAFLVLRAQDVGLHISYVPLIMVVMNIFYAGAAYPAGAAADHMSKRRLLFMGLVLLIAADLVLAFASSTWLVFTGAALWGLHMAFTQGLLAKLVADTVPPDLLGTGFGVFNLISGGALLLASVVAGMLWTAHGATATFLAGAVFAVVAVSGLLFAVMWSRPSN